MSDSNDSTAFALSEADHALLRRRAERYAKTSADLQTSHHEVVVFRRGTLQYAIPVEALSEIQPLRTLTALPGAAPAAPAVLHYRGQILSAHDLHAFMGAAEPGKADWMLVIDHGGERFALLADEVQGVTRLVPAEHGPVPVSLGQAGSCFGALLPGQILLLDAAGLLENPSFSRAF